jgi:DNA-binding NtrC family response regulator
MNGFAFCERQHRRLRDEVKRLRQVGSDTRGLDQVITGDSGTGKELVNRAVHQRGRSSTWFAR